MSSLVAQLVKNLPAMQEMWVQFLGQEDPLEKEMALQYSCLGNPMERGAWWVIQSMGSQRVGPDGVTNTFTFTLRIFASRIFVVNPAIEFRLETLPWRKKNP